MKIGKLLNEMFDKKIDSKSVMESVKEFTRFGEVLNRNEEFIAAAKNIVSVDISKNQNFIEILF